MAADKIKRPLLLVHGEEDNNPGTFPLQSERFYQALKGHGAPCRLVLLPHESHGYRYDVVCDGSGCGGRRVGEGG